MFTTAIPAGLSLKILRIIFLRVISDAVYGIGSNFGIIERIFHWALSLSEENSAVMEYRISLFPLEMSVELIFLPAR